MPKTFDPKNRVIAPPGFGRRPILHRAGAKASAPVTITLPADTWSLVRTAIARELAFDKLTKARAVQTTGRTKSLTHVAWLAALLSELGCLEVSLDIEAALEGDESTIAARFTEIIHALGQVLLDMTTEEVDELLADEAGGSLGAADPIEMMAARCEILRRLRRVDYASLARVMDDLGDPDAARRARVRHAEAQRLGLGR